MSAQIPNYSQLVDQAQIAVVKVGSALLVDDSGQVRTAWLEALAADLAQLREQGKRVVLVSSGAIRVGLKQMGLKPGEKTLAEQQAAAALGQISLAQQYANVFAKHNWPVGQMLLTASDTEERRRYLNSRETLRTLLANGALPLVNENDSVSTGEIRFGDNDRLAARVAGMIGADVLYLLSDIDGLYTANPREDASAQHVPLIEQAVSQEVEAMAGVVKVGYSSGGMVTKLAAARIALAAGCDMLIADGREPAPLSRLAAGERFTHFRADKSKHWARGSWLTGSLSASGALVLDPGAVEAVRAGKSLLPAGVCAVQGDFQRGDIVSLEGPHGKQVGRGLVLYDAVQAEQLVGVKSVKIAEILGFTRGPNLVHADDLATFE